MDYATAVINESLERREQSTTRGTASSPSQFASQLSRKVRYWDELIWSRVAEPEIRPESILAKQSHG